MWRVSCWRTLPCVTSQYRRPGRSKPAQPCSRKDQFQSHLQELNITRNWFTVILARLLLYWYFSKRFVNKNNLVHLPGISFSWVFISFQSYDLLVSKHQSTTTLPLSVTTGPYTNMPQTVRILNLHTEANSSTFVATPTTNKQVNESYRFIGCHAQTRSSP